MRTTTDRPTKRYIVRYEGVERDAGMGGLDWRCYAYDAEHAEQLFLDTDPDSLEGWVIVSVARPVDPHGKVSTAQDRALCPR